MPEYIYLIHPFREGFFQTPTANETSAMEEHFEYLQKAVEAGTVLLAGPCLDDTFGVIILQAENDEKARNFMYNDPAVRGNVMVAELHPLRIALRAK